MTRRRADLLWLADPPSAVRPSQPPQIRTLARLRAAAGVLPLGRGPICRVCSQGGAADRGVGGEGGYDGKTRWAGPSSP